MPFSPTLIALPAMVLLAFSSSSIATADTLRNSEQARAALEKLATQDAAIIARRWGAFAGAVGQTWVWESNQFSWDSWRWLVKGSAMLGVSVRCVGGTCDKAERLVQYNDQHERLDFFDGNDEIERTGKVQKDGAVIIYAGSSRFFPLALNTVRYDPAARTFAYSSSMVMRETSADQLKRLAAAFSPEALATVAFLPADAPAPAAAAGASPAAGDTGKRTAAAKPEVPGGKDTAGPEAPTRASAEAATVRRGDSVRQPRPDDAAQPESKPISPGREPVASAQAKGLPKTGATPGFANAATAGGKTIGKLYWFCSFFDERGRNRTAYYSQTGELLEKRVTRAGTGGYYTRTGERVGGFVEAKAKLQQAWAAYLARTHQIDAGPGAYCSSDMRPDVIDEIRVSSKAQKRNNLGFQRIVQTEWTPDGSE